MRAKALAFGASTFLGLVVLVSGQQCPSAEPPVAQSGILQALRRFGKQANEVLTNLVVKQGADFKLDSETEKELRGAGAQQKLLDTIRNSYCQPPPPLELKPSILFPPLRSLPSGAHREATTPAASASSTGVAQVPVETLSKLEEVRIQIELLGKVTFPARLLLIGPKPPPGGPLLPIEGTLTVTSTEFSFLSADSNYGFRVARKDVVEVAYVGLDQAAFTVRTASGGQQVAYMLAHRSGRPEDSMLLTQLLAP